MKIALYTPPLNDNPNDQLIIDGIKVLLGDNEFYEFRYGQDIDNGCDLLVVCGTPWIFEDARNSFKINELKRILPDFKGKKPPEGLQQLFRELREDFRQHRFKARCPGGL